MKQLLFKNIKSFSTFLMLLAGFVHYSASPQLSFPITQEQIIRYVNTYGILKSEYQAQTKAFTAQEILIPIQDKNSSFEPPTPNLRYFEVGKFDLDGYTYKLIIYNPYYYGETSELYTQLNSYDQNGNLIDALLLDLRYSYEEFNAFSNFTINNNTIDIDNYEFQTAEIVSGGDLGYPIENMVPYIRTKRKYQIERGKFRRVLIPITQELLTPFFVQKPYTYASYLTTYSNANARSFKKEENKIPIKGKANDYGYRYFSYEGLGSFEVDQFELDGYTYKIIMYEYGEPGGVQVLNTQLNSYDQQKKLVDALLLERRYSYDYFATFAKFTIDQDNVSIDNYVFDTFERLDSYKKIGRPIENPVHQLRAKERYKIDRGEFKLLSLSEYPTKYDWLIKYMYGFR